MATIGIEGIEIRAYHGVYAEEKREGNDFVVDIWLETEISEAARTDTLGKTIDYAAVYQLVLDIMEEPVDLLETLVLKLGKSILAEFIAATSCKLRIRKLNPLGMPKCSSTYVAESFHRK